MMDLKGSQRQLLKASILVCALVVAPVNVIGHWSVRLTISGDLSDSKRTAASRQTPPRLILSGHRSRVRGFAFNPNSTQLASWSWDGCIKLWDTATGKCVATLRKHQETVLGLSYSADGKTLTSIASKADERQLEIITWDVARAKPLTTDTKVLANVTAATISPNYQDVAGVVGDFTVAVWTWHTWRERLRLRGEDGFILGIAFCPSGRLLATSYAPEAFWPAKVAFWNARNGQLIASSKQYDWCMTSLGFSPSGKTLAAGVQKTIVLLEAATGAERCALKSKHGFVYSLAFSPDGNALAAGVGDYRPLGGALREGGDPGGVIVLDVRTGDQLMLLKVSRGIIRSVCFSPDGRYLAATNGETSLAIWDLSKNQGMQKTKGGED